jgi:hypothetical protein
MGRRNVTQVCVELGCCGIEKISNIDIEENRYFELIFFVPANRNVTEMRKLQ